MEELTNKHYKKMNEAEKKQLLLKGTKNPKAESVAAMIASFHYQRKEMKSNQLFTTGTTSSSLLKTKSSNYSIDQLKPILLSDLIIENIHSGKVLIGKTIAPSFKINAISLLIEDQFGKDDAICVAIYNYILPDRSDISIEGKLDSIFPIGTIVAIKEPYLKIAKTGNPSIRLDDPYDLEVIEDPNNIHLFNKIWKKILQDKIPKDADSWKNRGNEYYKNGDYEKALIDYNNGLKIEPEHEFLALNKIAALLALGKYHECINVGDTLLTKIPENEKLLSRLGKSYYQIGMYKKSMDSFEKIKKFLPNSKEATKYIQKCKERNVELEQGKYNFKKIKSEFKITKEVDCSEFIGPVKIINTEGKGRGLACTQDIPVGTLLMVSKGVGVFHSKDSKTAPILDFTVTDKMVLTFESQQIVSMVNKCINNDPKVCNQLSKLFAGPRYNIVDEISLDDFNINQDTPFYKELVTRPSIDQIKSIVIHNAFEDEEHTTKGLWLLPSLINHSCMGNSTRFCIGETMFITTTKNLKANDEILMEYISKFTIYQERSEKLLSFGFTCQCSLCLMDRKEINENNILRKNLRETFEKEIAPGIRIQNELIIPLLQKNIEDTKKTYSPNSTLQLELFLPLTGLAVLYQKKSQYENALRTYLECLNYSGFKTKFELKKTQLSNNEIDFIIKNDETLEYQYTDLFMHIAKISFQLGYETTARQCLALSKLTAKIFISATSDEITNDFISKGLSNNLLKYNDTIKIL